VSGATRTEDITRTLREEVLRGQYRPGERLPSERELAARFETTRDVARVALKKLEQLGMATVQPGGARVQPLAESSLDAIGHLLQLESPPDPALVDQMLEVVGALAAANVRMALEHASPERLEEAMRVLQELRKPGLDGGERHLLVHQLAHAFMDANDNLVMRVMRRTLHTELFPALLNVHAALEGAVSPPAIFDRIDLGPCIEAIAKAVEQRDGLAGYEAVHQMLTLFRQNVRAVLEEARR
jgi:GntR family transcriptional repressor for pyruvate dehydrogenase complex